MLASTKEHMQQNSKQPITNILRPTLVLFWLSLMLMGCQFNEQGVPNPEGLNEESLFIHIPCADTCKGCCDENNTCQSGLTPDNCGRNGERCNTCTVGGTCIAGTCWLDTCSENCKGCCDENNRCRPGHDLEFCGEKGASCQNCNSGKLPYCTGERCQAEGPNYYALFLEYAQIPPMSTLVCGILSPCDLYVTIQAGSTTATSHTIRNNNRPIWNEKLITVKRERLFKTVLVKVFDRNPGYSTRLTECYLMASAVHLRKGYIQQKCGPLETIRFSFQPVYRN